MPILKLTPADVASLSLNADESLLLDADNVAFFPTAEHSDGIGRLRVTSQLIYRTTFCNIVVCLINVRFHCLTIIPRCTLYSLYRSITWLNAQTGGIQLDFRSIVIHAVAACDTSAQSVVGPKCVYCQLDISTGDDEDTPVVRRSFRFCCCCCCCCCCCLMFRFSFHVLISCSDCVLVARRSIVLFRLRPPITLRQQWRSTKRCVKVPNSIQVRRSLCLYLFVHCN
jgi:hypothetical protein